MTSNFDIDQAATLLKQHIDQLFDIEAQIYQRRGITELHGASLWSEFADVKKYIWLDHEQVVVIGKSSQFYRIYLDQHGQRTSIFYLLPEDEEHYKLMVLRQGPWIERFFHYVQQLASQEPQQAAAQDNFQPIDF
jgi:hypothetical protein